MVWRRHLGKPRVTDYLVALSAWLFFPPNMNASGDDAVFVVQLLAGTVASIALLRRRERPVAVLAIGIVSVLVMTFYSSHPVLPGALVVALYSTGRYASAHVSSAAAMIAGLCYSGALVGLHALRMPILGNDADGKLSTAALIAGLLLLPIFLLIALGQLVRLRHELRERDRAELSAAAVRAERARIARELHDVVVHHISTMNVLVGASRVTLRADPAQAEGILAMAEQNGRDAIAELRHLLHVLRVDVTRRSHDDDHAVGAAALSGLWNACGTRVSRSAWR